MQHQVKTVPMETFNITPDRIVGVLDAFFETGTEGIIWSIVDNDKQGYDALYHLKRGDYLFVEDGTGTIEWDGLIDFDWDINFTPYPANPEYGQQAVLGYWVHGLQKEIDPERWAKWFFESRPAVVLRSEHYASRSR